ncbi:hypothetical protein [Clostridium sp.]|uniref:hypothetical protein n=1 Tax=Clostridium sp. TaxID=1506 RepID=UPI001EBA6F55|nr:hypothetical protein [Clostridium sp.]MBS5883807.1 hypothetical protein [Clostridium sp.]
MLINKPMILMVLSLAYVINYYVNDVCNMSDLTKNNIDSLYKEITLAINNRINKVVSTINSQMI